MAKDMTLRSGVPVDVDIRVGFALPAWFEFTLWDPTGKTFQLIGQGVNTDAVPDSFRVAENVSADLDQYILGWRVTVGAIGDDKQRYKVTITVSQNGQPVQNGVYVREGEFEGGKAVFDNSRLIVR